MIFKLAILLAEVPDLSEIVQKFMALQETVNTATKRNICIDFNATSSLSCDIDTLCNALDINPDSLYRYVNEKGDGLPNYTLYKLGSELVNCYDSNKDTKYDQVYNQLLKEVEKYNLKEEFQKFEQAVSNLSLDAVSYNKTPNYLNDGEIAKEFDKIAKSINISFPKSIKQKYIESVKLSSSKLVAPIFNNPFIDIYLATDSSVAGSKKNVLQNQETLKNKLKKVEIIFENTKKDVINFLDKQIKLQPLAKKQYDAMKKRITTVKMMPLSPANAYGGEACSIPNAFYQGVLHEIIICPPIYEYPDMAIKEVIAHELAHAIDPCHMTKPLVHISNAKMISDQDVMDVEHYFELGNVYDYSNFYAIDIHGSSSKNLKDNYISYDIKIDGDSVSFKDNPTLSVINCLTSDKSIAAKIFDKEDVISRYSKMFGSIDENDPEDEFLIAIRDNYDETLQDFKGCAEFSQIQESWSDWLASNIIGDTLSKTNPKDVQKEAFEAIIFHLNNVCIPKRSKMVKIAEEFAKKNSCFMVDFPDYDIVLNNMENDLVNPYPSDRDRLSKIFLASPKIRAALGCDSSKGVEYCE